MGKYTCKNPNGCGADFSIPGNLEASVIIKEGVIAENHGGQDRLVSEKHPFRTPGTKQEYQELRCVKCGASAEAQFPCKTVHTTSINGALKVDDDEED